MFIDRLRESSNLCIHPNDAYDLLEDDQKNMGYRCRICQHSVSVADFLCGCVSPLWSPSLAREFAVETGLVHTPCKFLLNQFGLVPEVVVTRLSVVHRGLELLKAIHLPFVADTAAADRRLFKTLMTEYMSLIDRVSLECDRTAETVKLILTNMKDAFSKVDMHDQYFNVLAPYVKRAARLPPPITGIETFRNDHLGIALDGELKLSAAIRKNFSFYCVPFDVIHTMVLCYLCGTNHDLVYNIVLDFAARLCCGYFSFPISRTFQTGIDIQHYLDNHILRTTNFKLYTHVQKYEESLADYMGEEFLMQYAQLEAEIRDNVPLARSRDKIERFIYQQTFPYMLFKDDSDYYAFVLALAHFGSKTNVGSSKNVVAIVPGTSVPKGVERECKRIYRFVKKCMEKVKQFTRSGSDRVYWTKDDFDLFVASDPHFAKELVDIIDVMMPSGNQ